MNQVNMLPPVRICGNERRAHLKFLSHCLWCRSYDFFFFYRDTVAGMTSLPHSAVSLPPDISRGYQYIAVQWSFISVSILVVSLRFCIRGLLRKRIGEDDYTILAALVSYLPPNWRLSNQQYFRHVPSSRVSWQYVRSRQDLAGMLNTCNLRK